MSTQILDLTSAFPRRGREELGGYAWLARLADKARAEDSGTGGDYIAYCPLSVSWLQRVGVERTAFDERIRNGASDDELVRFMNENVSAEKKAAGNQFVLAEMASHLDEQDAEEGR